MRLHANVEKRLAEIRAETVRLRETLRMLDEQIAHAQEVAGEAEMRALVASTPLADRERRTAADDLRRVRRERDATAHRLTALGRELDGLLDRMLERAHPSAADDGRAW